MWKKELVLIGHFDVHGVTSLAALLAGIHRAGFPEPKKIICRYPDCSPEGLPDILKQLKGETAIILDIPVDVKNPEKFIESFTGVTGLYADHHLTSKSYMRSISKKGFYTLYCESASLMTALALKRLNLPTEDDIIRDLLAVGGTGDRDSIVVRSGLWSPRIQQYSDALDVLLREMSSSGKADYSSLVKELAEKGLEAVDASLANKIPSPSISEIECFGRVALVNRRLTESWSGKELERAAEAAGVPYAVGYGYAKRFNNYYVCAVLKWTERAKDPELPVPWETFKRAAEQRGYKIIGHPDAPKIIGIKTEGEARVLAREAALELFVDVEHAVEKEKVKTYS